MTSGESIHCTDFSLPGIAGQAKGTYQLSVPLDPALPYHFGSSQMDQFLSQLFKEFKRILIAFGLDPECLTILFSLL